MYFITLCRGGGGTHSSKHTPTFCTEGVDYTQFYTYPNFLYRGVGHTQSHYATNFLCRGRSYTVTYTLKTFVQRGGLHTVPYKNASTFCAEGVDHTLFYTYSNIQSIDHTQSHTHFKILSRWVGSRTIL